MKKIFALLLMVVMSVTLLAGCGSDPVYDDLENFLNVEMVEINADYEKITAEVGTWETLEDDIAIKKSIDYIKYIHYYGEKQIYFCHFCSNNFFQISPEA